jgi:hypothetical protein
VAGLVHDIVEFFAALLSVIGFVGRPRRRAAIRDDLALLRELDDFPGDEFGPGTLPHIWLVGHIYQQVGEFAGLDLRTEKRAAFWPSIIIATTVWASLGWLAYHLVARGYGWWATFPAVPAGLFFLVTISMLTQKEPVGAGGDLSEYEDREVEDGEDLSALGELSDEDSAAR